MRGIRMVLSQRHACRVAKQSGMQRYWPRQEATLSVRFLSCHKMKKECSARGLDHLGESSNFVRNQWAVQALQATLLSQ
jgi:hypothetical protein